MSQKTAVVVGGGIAGLASAALLAKAGMKVTLLEAREKVGGRAYIWEKDGFVFDMGPSWYLMPDAFDQFFKLALAPRLGLAKCSWYLRGQGKPAVPRKVQ